MDLRPLGRTDIHITPIGFGAFKIGRNLGVKYPSGYELPDDVACEKLLNGVLDLGITLIDTAPAYGISEERIGRFLSHRRSDFVLSSKVGETFQDNRSTYDYSREAVIESIRRSARRMRTDVIDLMFIHSNGRDMEVLTQTDVVSTLLEERDNGNVRAIGLSAKTIEGTRAALEWADVVMVEYNAIDSSHAEVMNEAAQRGVGILVKKGLASGTLRARDAVQFVLANADVTSLVVGGLNLQHLRENIAAAEQVLQGH